MIRLKWTPAIDEAWWGDESDDDAKAWVEQFGGTLYESYEDKIFIEFANPQDAIVFRLRFGL